MKPKIGIFVFYYLLKFLNLIPFSFNLKNFDIKTSKKSILWSIIFCAAFIIHRAFIGNFGYKLRKDLSRDRKDDNNYTDLFLPAYAIILFATMLRYCQNKLTFNLIERTKLIFHRIKCFGVPWKYQCKIDKILYKYFCTQLINLICDFAFFILYNNASLLLNVIYTPLLGIKFLFSSALLMKYDISLILLKSSFSQVNKIIHKKIVKFKNHKNDAKITEQIDELIQIYFNLCDIYEMILQLFSIPLILIVGFIFFVVESSIVLYENLKIHQTKFLGFFLTFVWTFVKVRDIYLVFKSGNGILKKVSKKIMNAPLFHTY